MNPDPTSLDRLHDIVAPPPVPLWPPAPGWYYVLALLLVLILVLGFRMFAHWQRNRYRREALAELHQEQLRLADPASRTAALAAMSVLLKRTAITAYSRPAVAALTGREWFAFLDRTGGTTAFSTIVGAKLAAATYDPADIADLGHGEATLVADAVSHWIKHHQSALEQKDAKIAEDYEAISPPRPSRASVQKV